MRVFEIALATLALRAAPTEPPKHERRLIPAVDEPDAAMLNRAALPQQRAALIASLWPAPTRQCVAAPVFAELPAPAIFGAFYRVTWTAVPRQRPPAAFPRPESESRPAPQARAA